MYAATWTVNVGWPGAGFAGAAATRARPFGAAVRLVGFSTRGDSARGGSTRGGLDGLGGGGDDNGAVSS